MALQISTGRDGRTPLHEMAARGEAPTVLLLAAEPDDEITSSSGGGAGDDDSAVGDSGVLGRDGDSGAGTGSGSNSNGSIDDTDSSSIGGGSGDDHDTFNEPDGVAATLGSSSPLPSSVDVAVSPPSPAAEPTGAGVAEGVATDTPSTLGPVVAQAALCLIRSPRPLSAFAAPSLSDTDDEHSTHTETQGQASDMAGANQPRHGPSNHFLKNGEATDEITAVPDPDENGDALVGSTPRERGSRGMNRSTEDEASAWKDLLDVNVRCSVSGNCPLHEAAASGSVGAVLSLLYLGADTSITNACGDTALHVSGHLQIMYTARRLYSPYNRKNDRLVKTAVLA